MRLEQTLSFRKEIIPWYDADAACYLTIGLLLPVLFFSVVGLTAARQQPSPAAVIWVPILLAGLSGAVLISVGARLIKRLIVRRMS